MYRVILETCPNAFSTFMSITPCGLGPEEGLDTPDPLNFSKSLHRSQALGLTPAIPAFGWMRLDHSSRQVQANTSHNLISKIASRKQKMDWRCGFNSRVPAL
jgi:hypothetical protein